MSKLKKIGKVYKVSDIRHLVCPSCSNKFIAFNDKKRFCSDICKKSYHNKSKEIDISKEVIFRRDGYKCIYCGLSSIEDGVKLHLEHVYPISEGGKEDLFNLATACERCNIKKNALILSEDLILRIWERNQKLNEKFIPKEYEELTEIFKKDVEQRLRR